MNDIKIFLCLIRKVKKKKDLSKEAILQQEAIEKYQATNQRKKRKMANIPEDEEYKLVTKYKNELISQKENERDKAWDSGNRLDVMLTSQLIFISSAVLALIGSVVLTTDITSINGEMKVILASSFIFIALSLVSDY